MKIIMGADPAGFEKAEAAAKYRKNFGSGAYAPETPTKGPAESRSPKTFFTLRKRQENKHPGSP